MRMLQGARIWRSVRTARRAESSRPTRVTLSATAARRGRRPARRGRPRPCRPRQSLDQAIDADERSRRRRLGQTGSGRPEKIPGAIVRRQERSGSAGTGAPPARVESAPHGARVALNLNGRVEEGIDGRQNSGSAMRPPAGPVTRTGVAQPSSARYSQARAKVQCRLTVAGEMPSTSPVSSIERPAK